MLRRSFYDFLAIRHTAGKHDVVRSGLNQCRTHIAMPVQDLKHFGGNTCLCYNRRNRFANLGCIFRRLVQHAVSSQKRPHNWAH